MQPCWDSSTGYWSHYKICRVCSNSLFRYNINCIEYDWLQFIRGRTCDMPGCDEPCGCYDHDHETGKFRGFLCRQHNTGLGKLGDNLEGLTAAVQYLTKEPDDLTEEYETTN